MPTWGSFTWGTETWGSSEPLPTPDGSGGVSSFLPTFGLAVADLPTEEAKVITTIDPRVVDVNFTSTIWGGYNEGSVGFAFDANNWPRAYLAEAIDIRELMHGMIVLGNTCVFTGRIVELNLPAYGEIRGCTMSGYGIEGMNDDWWREGGIDLVQCHRILTRAVAQHAPMLSVDLSSLTCTRVDHQPDEFVTMTPGQIAEVLVTEGGQDIKQAWMLLVYDDGLVQFMPMIPPTVPDYIVSIDETVAFRKVAREMAGAVSMVYQDANGTQRITDRQTANDFISTYRFMREKILTGSSNSETQAAVFAQTWLQQHSTPQWYGQIKREGWHGLQKPNGEWVPPCNLRAGEWVYFHGLDVMLPITQIAFKASDASITTDIELGFAPPRTTEGFFRSLAEANAGIRTKRSPLTKAREPFGRIVTV